VPDVPDGFPRLKGETRPWSCKAGVDTCTRTAPCPACRGARNRRKGKRGQGQNRRVLEDVFDAHARWAGDLANEETASHLPVRYENKAGRMAGPVATAYLHAEAQSEAAKAVGDLRPFVATFSPDNWGDGLIVIRLSRLRAVLEAFAGSPVPERKAT